LVGFGGIYLAVWSKCARSLIQDLTVATAAHRMPAFSRLGAIMRILFLAPLVALPVLLPSAASGHGGGLNAEGCHNNRKTGDYHCHRGSIHQAVSSQPKRASNGTTYYRNCSHARAAGAAPVRVGEPGYGKHLDRDGDGVGCE
jgi:hypothetical protein